MTWAVGLYSHKTSSCLMHEPPEFSENNHLLILILPNYCTYIICTCPCVWLWIEHTQTAVSDWSNSRLQLPLAMSGLSVPHSHCTAMVLPHRSPVPRERGLDQVVALLGGIQARGGDPRGNAQNARPQGTRAVWVWQGVARHKGSRNTWAILNSPLIKKYPKNSEKDWKTARLLHLRQVGAQIRLGCMLLETKKMGGGGGGG